MTDKTGGAAFPVAYNSETQDAKFGMTLRDYLAAKAMQGDLASQSVSLGSFDNDAPDESLVNRANFYYRMADAMLKARG
ncbi:hypothetical protein JZM10_02680 [Providencia rettgeri]|uniref:hypothetical protein n=1 Tax=Providencia rettgeri TaxID=587 RepID=UPI00197DC925|nr:hypothetical protein [Providencia rettgeri]MBN6350371.1 hypothetical protein [Providencia rettgeri]